MNKLKVIVENLPGPTPWYQEYAPIIIAALAFFVSVLSVAYARKTFILN